MKIYEIGTGYTPIPARMGAATEIVVEELTKSMLKQGVDVELIDIYTADRLPNQLPITEVKVPPIFSGTDVQLGIMHKLKRVVYSICLAKKLAGILRKTEEKVVLHFHNQYNMFFFEKLVLERNKKKAVKVYTNHSGIWRLPWKDYSKVIQKRYFQEKLCMQRADVTFALNKETIENFVTYCGGDANKLININNGVNTNIYKPLTEEERQEIHIKYNLEGKKVVLQVGSIYENKGQKEVIQWLSPLLRENKSFVYVYIGGVVSEKYHDEMQTMARELGVQDQVIYLGMITPGMKLNELYNMAEATICASKYEGFSLTIVESLAAGTPVLINQFSPYDIGAGCVLYQAETIGEIVRQKIGDPKVRKELSCNARKNACENFSWDIIAQEHIMVFCKHMAMK